MPGSKRLQANPSRQFSNSHNCIFLLRHGQIQDHEIKRFIGRTDIPLDETGRAQARAWKKNFSHICFNKIYTSSLSRCRDTADILGQGQEICIDPRLNEIDLGTWDGKSFEHIKKTEPLLFQKRGERILTFRPPKGESFNDLLNRVSPFFETLEKGLKAPTLVITHSGVIRVILCRYLGMDPGQLFEIKSAYGQLFLLGPV